MKRPKMHGSRIWTKYAGTQGYEDVTTRRAVTDGFTLDYPGERGYFFKLNSFMENPSELNENWLEMRVSLSIPGISGGYQLFKDGSLVGTYTSYSAVTLSGEYDVVFNTTPTNVNITIGLAIRTSASGWLTVGAGNSFALYPGNPSRCFDYVDFSELSGIAPGTNWLSCNKIYLPNNGLYPVYGLETLPGYTAIYNRTSMMGFTSANVLLLPNNRAYHLYGASDFSESDYQTLTIEHCGNVAINNCSDLSSLSLNNSVTEALDISNNPNLTGIGCPNGNLNSLTVTNCPKLNSIGIYNNHVSEMSLDDVSELINVAVYKNRLSSLDMSGATKLQKLHAYENDLESLNLTGCTALTQLIVNRNRLTSISIPNINQAALDLSYNRLQAIESFSTAIRDLYLRFNRLVSLDLTNVVAGTTRLFLEHNKISGITFGPMSSTLQVLYLNYNNMQAIDIAGLPNLLDLRLSNQVNLTMLTLESSSLVSLFVNNNKLVYLNMSMLTVVERVFVQVNKITDIVLPTYLTYTYTFWAYDNKLPVEIIDEILVKLAENSVSNGNCNLSGGTNAAPSATGLAAKATLESRGWTVTVNY